MGPRKLSLFKPTGAKSLIVDFEIAGFRDLCETVIQFQNSQFPVC